MSKTRVRMLTGIAGLDFSFAPKQVVEIDAAEAANWIAAGIAEPAGRPTKETAAAPAATETAEAAKPKPKQRR